MRRLRELEARRLALIARSERQRHELAYRLAELSPAALLAHWTRRAPHSAASHPLAWLASLATLYIMVRERRLLGWITRFSRGVSLLSRASGVVRLFRQIRAPGESAR